MSVYYDQEGDFLEITSGDISKSTFDNLGDGIFEIIDADKGEVKGIAIFGFKERTKQLNQIKVRLPFKFTISSL